MDVDVQNIENSTMPCKHCEVEFTTKSDLHDHIKISHTDNVDEIETHEKEMPKENSEKNPEKNPEENPEENPEKNPEKTPDEKPTENLQIQATAVALTVQQALLNPAFIAQFTLALKEAEKSQKKIELDESKDYWVEDEQFWICNACFFHSKSPPGPLLVHKKGNFGYVSKKQKPSNIKTGKKEHCENKLHEWCVDEFEKKEEKKIADKIKNEIVGKKIIRNALLCFKRSLGSEDFLALNEKDFLAEKDIGNKIFNIATKNDSRAQYFKMRGEVFELLSKKTKQFFETIEDIAVTLDKGQLISNCLFGAVVSTKKPTIFFKELLPYIACKKKNFSLVFWSKW